MSRPQMDLHFLLIIPVLSLQNDIPLLFRTHLYYQSEFRSVT